MRSKSNFHANARSMQYGLRGIKVAPEPHAPKPKYRTVAYCESVVCGKRTSYKRFCSAKVEIPEAKKKASWCPRCGDALIWKQIKIEETKE